MPTIFRRNWLARVAGLAAFGLGGRTSPARQPAQQPAQPPAPGANFNGQVVEQPAPHWLALLKVLPEKYRVIDVYAENPSRTLIPFRSQGETAVFEVAKSTLRPIPHQVAVGRVNRITFEARPPDMATGFIL